MSVKYHQDWSRDGVIVVHEPKTINLYEEWINLRIQWINREYVKTESDLEQRLRETTELVVTKCDPQEVYFYEWNNHECMYHSDAPAMARIIRLFGSKEAENIQRVNAAYSISDIDRMIKANRL